MKKHLRKTGEENCGIELDVRHLSDCHKQTFEEQVQAVWRLLTAEKERLLLGAADWTQY